MNTTENTTANTTENTTENTTPAGWSATDEHFFRIVSDVFPLDLVWGAGALLASYDPETAASCARN